MQSEQGESWAAGLMKALRKKVEVPAEAGEEVLHRFQVPSAAEAEVALGCLLFHKVDLFAARIALAQAMKEAMDQDQDWLESLHKVVNRAVRTGERGWEKWGADWLEVQRAVAAANGEGESPGAFQF